jgi:hypothetical protein
MINADPREDTRETQSDRTFIPERQPLNILATEKIHVTLDRGRTKTFYLDLIENDRGKVVRITENVNGRRDRIMVPADAIQSLKAALDLLLK